MNGPNIDPMQLAMNMLRSNPNVAQTPMGQQFMQVLQRGDAQAGAQMAMNICNSMGKTPQQMMQEIQQTMFRR